MKYIQLQYLPHSIYFYNITLLITTFYVKMNSNLILKYFMWLISSHIFCTQFYYLKMAKLAETFRNTH